jgi:hypothetical protein
LSDLAQFVAGGACKLGVQSQYLDGELHLVDDALSGTVAAGEKFQILDTVFSSLSVFVMYRFFREQIAADVLRHNVAMFHDVSLPISSGKFGHGYPNIAVAFYMFFVAAAFKALHSVLFLRFYFAIMIAVFLLFVEATARFSSLWIHFAARQASEGIARFTSFAATYTRALARAVQRISCVFLMVRSEEIFHHREILATFLASEAYWYSAVGGDAFTETVCSPTPKPAISPVFAREAGKRTLAIFTDFLNRHWLVPSFGDEGTIWMSIGTVK